ncbi:hypothetical protein [Mycolicibacterium moriokaense]|uniref:Uncharacterized protein n=1 Tax=Mycolicibacterium moriokaense TaxID=39691 RepID=A0AAD1M7B0_9MYCO|nr:hypothetical protein [Mycolicibacterium moriokaense]MCV7037113.1 hypothetical protein [Mycolicibacterium moriokaense]BBX02266.1 hypothetical protein MMOR_32020 [Mycolicibacterium moriokaense]
MSVRGVLVCYRSTDTGPIAAEWTYWDSPEEARRAEAELTPCSELCCRTHSVVGVDPQVPVRRGGRPRREDVIR